MNILNVTHALFKFGGLETFLKGFINLDKDNNHYITTFARNEANTEGLNIKKPVYPLNSFYDLPDIVKENDIDIVVIHWTGHESLNGKGVAIVNPFLEQPLICLEPSENNQLTIDNNPNGILNIWSLFIHSEKKPKFIIICHAESKLSNFVTPYGIDLVVNVSHKASEAQKHVTAPQQVIYNGVDLSEFYPNENEKVNSNKIKVGWSGRLSKYDYEVYKLIKQDRFLNDTCDFYYWGNEYLDKEPLENHKFLGVVDKNDMPNNLRSLDIFFYPTTIDSFGLALVEAMASSLPCVTSTVLSEIIGDNNLVYFSPNQGIEILKDLVKNYSKRRKIGLQLKERAVKEFDILSMIDNYRAVYLRILNNGREFEQLIS